MRLSITKPNVIKQFNYQATLSLVTEIFWTMLHLYSIYKTNVLIIYRFLKNKCTNQYLLTHNHQHWKLWISVDSLELRESHNTRSISTFEILMRFVVTNSIDLHWFSVYQNCPHFYAVNNPGCLEIRVQKIFPVSIECSKKDIILIKWFCPKLINVIALLKLLADISRVSEGWSFFFNYSCHLEKDYIIWKKY